ncbi:MAG: hypothetical protein Q8R15_03880 [Candidatus Micrarchaeota archaeon]|nr:hypothetical protein [Candidatus Micrarchaeota archaeon]
MNKWLLGLVIGALFVFTVTEINSGGLTGLVVGANAGTSTTGVSSMVNKLTIDTGEITGLSGNGAAIINVATDLPANGDETPTQYCKRQGFNECLTVNAYTSQGLVETDCNINLLKGTNANNLRVCSLVTAKSCVNTPALTVTCSGALVEESSGSAITANVVRRGGGACGAGFRLIRTRDGGMVCCSGCR